MSAATSSGAHVVEKSRSIRRTGNRVTALSAAIGREMIYSPHSVDALTTSVKPVKIQNTHWYQAGWSNFSANPHTANESEIRRVGLHSCTGQDCSEVHAWSAEEYFRFRILERWAEEGFY